MLALAFVLAVQQQLSAVDRTQTVSTVWLEARYNFAYWDEVRADWDSAYRATLTDALEDQPDWTFYRRVRRMIALLNEGRTNLVLPSSLAARIARPPVEIRTVQGRPVIVAFAPTNEMRIARPEVGSEIMRVQGVPTEDWIRDSILPEIGGGTQAERWQRAVSEMLLGEKGTAVQLSLQLPNGTLRGMSLTRSASVADRWPLAPLPLAAQQLPGSIAWLRLTALAGDRVLEQFDRALAPQPAPRALIIDVRDATGGESELGYQLLARLTDRPFVTALRRARSYRPELRAVRGADPMGDWGAGTLDTLPPRAAPFAGPVVVLTSARTSGAAEDFLAAFRHLGRGPAVGEPTSGSAGDVVPIPLPGGAAFHICVTRHALPDGTDFTGRGIAPEVPVETTVQDIAGKRDPVLERAVEVVKGLIARRTD